jgi:hypothetical protein
MDGSKFRIEKGWNMSEKTSLPWTIQKPNYVAMALQIVWFSTYMIFIYLTETKKCLWPQGLIVLVLVIAFSFVTVNNERLNTLVCLKNSLKRFRFLGHQTIPWNAIEEVRLRKTLVRSPRLYIKVKNSSPIYIFPGTLSKTECGIFLKLIKKKISSKKVIVDRQLINKFFKKG